MRGVVIFAWWVYGLMGMILGLRLRLWIYKIGWNYEMGGDGMATGVGLVEEDQ
jgi:hypothetical protein